MTTRKQLLYPKYYTYTEGGFIKLWKHGPLSLQLLENSVNARQFQGAYDPIINGFKVHALFFRNSKTKELIRWDRINGKFMECNYTFRKVRGKELYMYVPNI